jgi:hypothetical protein
VTKSGKRIKPQRGTEKTEDWGTLTANDANGRESVREEIFAPGRPLGFGTFLPRRP